MSPGLIAPLDGKISIQEFEAVAPGGAFLSVQGILFHLLPPEYSGSREEPFFLLHCEEPLYGTR